MPQNGWLIVELMCAKSELNSGISKVFPFLNFCTYSVIFSFVRAHNVNAMKGKCIKGKMCLKNILFVIIIFREKA